jgi:methionyl-tRNA synthetase
LNTVLYVLAEGIRFVAVLLQPFITKAPPKIFHALNTDLTSFATIKKFGGLNKNKINKIDPLFPRVDLKEELGIKDKEGEKVETTNNIITINDFAKVELKVANVQACEKVEKSDKLLKLTVELGSETRTVVSGIAEHYAPEELVGKQVVLVSNLAPAKLRGIESQGMILCADTPDGKVVIVSPEKVCLSGSTVR